MPQSLTSLLGWTAKSIAAKANPPAVTRAPLAPGVQAWLNSKPPNFGVQFTGDSKQDSLIRAVFGLDKPSTSTSTSPAGSSTAPPSATGPTLTAPGGLGVDYGIGDYKDPATQAKAQKNFGKNWRKVLGLTEEQTATPVPASGVLTNPSQGAQDDILKIIFGPNYAQLLNLNPGAQVAGASQTSALAPRKFGEKGDLQKAIEAENERRSKSGWFSPLFGFGVESKLFGGKI